MKNKMALLCGLSLIACLGSSNSLEAYTKIPKPLSPTTVKVATLTTAACVWGLTTLGMATGYFDNSYNISAQAAPLLAAVPAAVAGALTWLICSSYTAESYARSAYAIVSGEHCSQPELLDFVRQSDRDEHMFVQRVLRYFAICKNERLRAVEALVALESQLSWARYYFAVAKRGSNCAAADSIAQEQEQVNSYIETITAGILEIKDHPDYQRQREAELQEQSINAQYATAHAMAQAAHTPSVQHHYIHHVD